MYLDINGEQFRILKAESQGAWLVSCDAPGPPRFVDQRELDAYPRAPAPEPCTAEQGEAPQTAAEQVRMALIQPLLDNGDCVSDPAIRRQLAAEAAQEHGTTSRRVLRLYYQYIATGAVMKHKSRERRPPEYENYYKRAIQTFYYSAKRPSLRDT